MFICQCDHLSQETININQAIMLKGKLLKRIKAWDEEIDKKKISVRAVQIKLTISLTSR